MHPPFTGNAADLPCHLRELLNYRHLGLRREDPRVRAAGRAPLCLDPEDPLDPQDQRACPKLVFRLRKTLLLPMEKPWGDISGAEKAPAGMGTRTT